MRAYGKRTLEQLEMAVTGAWYAESFARTKRLPDLEKLMRRGGKSSSRRVDREYTTRETLRWKQLLADKAKR